jgi:lipopolysaccharide/colanic/teichoic acid biosynthesis glycosyltransferase
MKRFFDFSVSLLALICLLPLFLILSLLVALSGKGGVFFKQKRIGKNQVPFSLLKFRSMRPNAENSGQLTVGDRDPRITRVGLFLRKSKLDELPQLINVLKGEMSIVGPRPEVEKYVQHYPPRFLKVLDVRPGITDPASIAFIEESELLAQATDPESAYIEEILPEKLALQLAYVEEQNAWKDLRVIVNTLKRIIQTLGS